MDVEATLRKNAPEPPEPKRPVADEAEAVPPARLDRLDPPVELEHRARLDLAAGGYPSQSLGEGRTRLLSRMDLRRGRWALRAGAYVDGYSGREPRARDAILRPNEIYLEYGAPALDLRVGYSVLVWGVLDEIQPTDRVNPLDLSRFALEGRMEARLPVPLVRSELFLPHDSILELVFVPFARKGTFDQLDESSSPFNPFRGLELPESNLPFGPSSIEAGLRFRGSSAGIDWGISGYRDVVDLDLYTAASGGPVPVLEAQRPVRDMLGGEIETLWRGFGLRGEVAVDFHDAQQQTIPLRIVRGRSVES